MCRDVCSSGVGRRNFPEPVASAGTNVCALLELMMTYIFGYHGASLLVKKVLPLVLVRSYVCFEVARDVLCWFCRFLLRPQVKCSVGVNCQCWSGPVEPGTNSTCVAIVRGTEFERNSCGRIFEQPVRLPCH